MKSCAVVGMLLFIASEAIFFLLLILAYVNFHKVTGHTAATMLDPVKTGLFSIALLSSSVTMWLSERAHKKKSNWARIWLFATIALGITFLIGQTLEYLSLLKRDITISAGLFGSTFFTLTGFHGLHVIIGVLLICISLALALLSNNREPDENGLKSIAIYWHFVDAVWMVIFPVVYLWRFV